LKLTLFGRISLDQLLAQTVVDAISDDTRNQLNLFE